MGRACGSRTPTRRSSTTSPARGLLVREEPYTHSYPHCWRCGTPLIYWAKTSWFVRTSRPPRRPAAGERAHQLVPRPHQARPLRRLAGEQRRLGPVARPLLGHAPAHLALRRQRPRHVRRVGGRAVASWPGATWPASTCTGPRSTTSPFPCPTPGCDARRARRVAPVLDAWFDSGSMPSAQHHYPFGDTAEFQTAFPADFICEAIDQTRGWFYSLLAVNTLVFGSARPTATWSCLAHVVDEFGQKMSKSKGNVLDPWHVFDTFGADALRWYFFSAGSPWTNRRVYEDGIREATRKTLITLWNVFAFFATYADLAGWQPGADRRPSADVSEGDWDPADGAERPRARPVGRGPAGADGRRRHRRPRRLRRPGRGHHPGRLRRRPVELVRPPVAAPLLGTGRRRARPRRLRHAVPLPHRGEPAAGPVLPVPGRRAVRARSPARCRCTCSAGPTCPTPIRPTPRLLAEMDAARRLVGPGPVGPHRRRHPHPPAPAAGAGAAPGRRPVRRGAGPRSPTSSTSRPSRTWRPCPTSCRGRSSPTSGPWGPGSGHGSTRSSRPWPRPTGRRSAAGWRRDGFVEVAGERLEAGDVEVRASQPRGLRPGHRRRLGRRPRPRARRGPASWRAWPASWPATSTTCAGPRGLSLSDRIEVVVEGGADRAGGGAGRPRRLDRGPGPGHVARHRARPRPTPPPTARRRPRPHRPPGGRRPAAFDASAACVIRLGSTRLGRIKRCARRRRQDVGGLGRVAGSMRQAAVPPGRRWRLRATRS